jgi:ligand-binding SRPBCC domain-containing protein
MAELVISRSSTLAASAEDVWGFATSEAGLEHEFGPWMRMTIPAGLQGKAIGDVAVGQPLGRSWILLGGFLPLDFDDLMIAEIGPGMRFVERSKLGSARSWQHQREVVATDEESCELTDTLTVVPRAPISALRADRLVERIVGSVFDHRHRRLRQRWGPSSS